MTKDIGPVETGQQILDVTVAVNSSLPEKYIALFNLYVKGIGDERLTEMAWRLCSDQSGPNHHIRHLSMEYEKTTFLKTNIVANIQISEYN